MSTHNIIFKKILSVYFLMFTHYDRYSKTGLISSTKKESKMMKNRR